MAPDDQGKWWTGEGFVKRRTAFRKTFNTKTVLLFQDMFPITASYISGQYIKGGQPVKIADPKLIQELEKTARKIILLDMAPIGDISIIA